MDSASPTRRLLGFGVPRLTPTCMKTFFLRLVEKHFVTPAKAGVQIIKSKKS
jgi:hypothetical protein